MSAWDVDSYRTEFESEEHWELRRNFMLANKDRLPEDEVVCLAQVFTNIELLGCKYPDETMRKVAELAKGVVEDYREKKKSCLKRTFVAASAAAVAKAKGSSRQINTREVKRNFQKISGNTNNGGNTVSKMGFSKFSKCVYDNSKIASHTYSHNEAKNGEKGDRVSHNRWVREIDRRLATSNFTHTLDPVNVRKLNNLRPQIVFFLFDEVPLTLLQKNAAINTLELSWQFEGSKNEKTCSLYYDDILLGSGTDKSVKKSLENAAVQAIKNLQSLCFTVKVSRHVQCVSKVTPATLELAKEPEERVVSGIGEQIMKMMGWQGGGLGPKQQGITEPIFLKANVGRAGFGLKLEEKPDKMFKKNVYAFLRNWKKIDSDEDLVFSSEFTDEQREILRNAASKLHLRSRTYGKGDKRYLVVFRQLIPRAILRKLQENGGRTNRYELFIPKPTTTR